MVLRNVPKTDTFEQQRQELNELAVDVFNLKQQVDTFNLNDLVDVTAAGATNSQIIKYNGTEWVLDTDIVSTSFTVVNASPGSNSNLAYNNTNGTFTYTPPDLSPYRLATATLNDIPGVSAFTKNALTPPAPSIDWLVRANTVNTLAILAFVIQRLVPLKIY